MVAFPETSIPEGKITYIKYEDKYYKFNSSNDVDAITGKWREYGNSENIHKLLFEEKTKQEIDVQEHYQLASVQDGTVGLKIVIDGNLTDETTEVELSTVNNKILDTDIHTYTEDEYVELIPATYKDVTYEESIYLPRTEVPEGSTSMTLDEFNTMFGTVTVEPYIKA